MITITVDFEVWKALTAQRKSERDSYNDVLCRLLLTPDATQPTEDAQTTQTE